MRSVPRPIEDSIMKPDYRIAPIRHHCTAACNHETLAQSGFFAAVEAGDLHAAGAGAGLAGTALAEDFRTNAKSKKIDEVRRILLKGGTVISMDPAVGDFARGDVLIESDRIAAVGATIDADATVIDASDMIVLPGFCDPHIHCWEGQLGRFIPNNMSTVNEDKGLPEPNPHPTRAYIPVLHTRFAQHYRPEDSYIGTLATLLAALNGGITTVCDNAHNSRSKAHSDAGIAALIDSGVRGVHAYGRPVAGDWDEQYPEDAYRLKETYFSSDDQLQTMRFYLVGRYPTEEIRAVSKVRRDLGVWLTFDSGIELQPVADFYAEGTFDGRETINHGTWVPLDKRKVLAANGAKVNVCPRIESQFRFGDIPYQDWIDVGIRPGLSNDNPATYVVSMFHEMRSLYAYQRARVHREAMSGLTRLPKLVTQRDMLESATIAGAENCALDHKTGSLTPGKQADIILINTGSIDLFPRNNALCTAVQGSDVGSVDTIFVAGRLMKWRGKLVGVDFPRIRAAMEASRDYLYGATDWPYAAVDFED
jgi:cytosine/adenosine deaminase-related metal-dependent hydrolase